MYEMYRGWSVNSPKETNRSSIDVEFAFGLKRRIRSASNPKKTNRSSIEVEFTFCNIFKKRSASNPKETNRSRWGNLPPRDR